MKPLQLVILLFSVLLLGAGLTILYYGVVHLQEYHEIPIDFELRDHEIGLNTDNDAIHFGFLSPGGKSSRHMTITPVKDALLIVRFDGDYDAYMRCEPNNVLVKGGEPVNLTLSLVPPEDAELGAYNATARFFFYKP